MRKNQRHYALSTTKKSELTWFGTSLSTLSLAGLIRFLRVFFNKVSGKLWTESNSRFSRWKTCIRKRPPQLNCLKCLPNIVVCLKPFSIYIWIRWKRVQCLHIHISTRIVWIFHVQIALFWFSFVLMQIVDKRLSLRSIETSCFNEHCERWCSINIFFMFKVLYHNKI